MNDKPLLQVIVFFVIVMLITWLCYECTVVDRQRRELETIQVWCDTLQKDNKRMDEMLSKRAKRQINGL